MFMGNVYNLYMNEFSIGNDLRLPASVIFGYDLALFLSTIGIISIILVKIRRETSREKEF
jgi:hypothetical protein